MSAPGGSGPRERVDVAIVGAGQAGLAVAHHLAGTGTSYVLLERADAVGSAWTQRWDSLTLFTPARYSALPGRAFPGGDPGRYPAGREVAGYLQEYATAGGHPVRLGTDVCAVRRDGDGFTLDLDRSAGSSATSGAGNGADSGTLRAGAVVVATGPFQLPHVPGFAASLDPSVLQLHTAQYRNPAQLPAGRVLVVGTGNSGLQIAAELAATHEVHLAAGSRQMSLPRRLLGRDIFWWLDTSGFTRAPRHRMPHWLAGDGSVLVGMSVPGTVRDAGLVLHPRAARAAGRQVGFADGSDVEVDAVVWATGYRSEFSWLPTAATDAAGRPVHRRGITPVDGLFYVGLENQYTSSSSLLGWVQRDAAFVAARARTHAGSAASATGAAAGAAVG